MRLTLTLTLTLTLALTLTLTRSVAAFAAGATTFGAAGVIAVEATPLV